MARNLLPPFDLLIHRPAAASKRASSWLCVLATVCLLGACGGDPDPTNTGDNTNTTYTIGGTLSGLADGQTLALSLGSETMTLYADGAFAFTAAVASGASYEVKVSGPQPAWQSCSVSNGTGSASVNVTTVAVSCVSADTAPTGQLNDTGIDWCSENITTPSTWVNNAVCSAVNWAANLWGQQQDAFFGRDAQAQAGTLTKEGSGMAGFDFTRIGASGKLLAQQGETWSDTGTEAASTQWDCVRDNTTGLVWEVKRNDATHLRHKDHTYTWYNPDASTNGGAEGIQSNADTCTGVADVNQCNTQSYVAAVNAVGLCGKTDWRLPTVDELRNLAHTGRSNPAIDVSHFPNTASTGYWSASPFASFAVSAWFVLFSFGVDFYDT